jgi:hypothetical protein
MPGFRHPQPFHRKEVAVMVAPAKVYPDCTPGSLLRIGTPAPESDRISISVSFSYRLSEYLSILTDLVAGQTQDPSKPASAISRFVLHASIIVIGTPLFYFKRRAMPHLTFHFDDKGIVRVSRAGTRYHAWASVKGVKRCTKGYVILLADQAMPLPYRCMDASQSTVFEALLNGHVPT